MKVSAEIYVAPEMLAAGVDAMRASKQVGLTEAETVLEIYMAVWGAGVKATCEGEETIH